MGLKTIGIGGFHYRELATFIKWMVLLLCMSILYSIFLKIKMKSIFHIHYVKSDECSVVGNKME